jgi:hypothetical protein
LADERWYHLAMEQPTFNMEFNLRLEGGMEGWSIKDPVVSPVRYYHAASGLALISRPNVSILNVRVPKWTLPGIAFVVEWGPPGAPK